MYLFRLLLSALMVAIGMLFLPPLSGSGLENLVSRLWLGFGLLVFSAHYLTYLQTEGERRQKLPHKFMTDLHLLQVQQHSSKQKSFLEQ